MIQIPSAQEIAAWPLPNYVNPTTRGSLVLGVEIPMVILVVIFCSMRSYARIFIVKGFGLDDWLMAAATVTFTAITIAMCVSTTPRFATGYHLWDVPPELLLDSAPTGRIALSIQLMFVIATALTKASILFTYLRIFVSESNRYFSITMLVFTGAWFIMSFCMTLFQCIPIQAYWLPLEYPYAKCLSVTTLFYTTGYTNVASDFLIFLWPAKDLARVQISIRQRVTLISMFCLGVFICIVAICRLWYTSVYVKSYDILWNGATLYSIVALEISIGIICGCLPACRPVMARMFPRAFETSNRSRSSARLSRISTKKGEKYGGPSFPFQSLNGPTLNGANVRSQNFSVIYDEAAESKGELLQCPMPALLKPGRDDPDNISSESQEWIMMDGVPKKVGDADGDESPV